MSEVSRHGQFRGASGMHPDADQLSALTERALPAHEREEVLAHLAICRDCRETVAMALPPAEEFEKVAEFEHVAAAAALVAQDAGVVAAAGGGERRRRFARWMVWAPAAAFAALALLLAYLHHAPPKTLPEQAQVARPQSPLESPAQAQPNTPAAGTPAGPAVTAKHKPAAQAKSAPASAGALNASIGGELALQPVRPASQLAQEPAGAMAGVSGERMKTNRVISPARGILSGNAPPPAPAVPPQVAAQPEGNAAGSAQGGLIPEPLPKPAAPAAAPAASAMQTVEVAKAGAPVETTSPDIANASVVLNEVHGTILLRPLPGRQGMLSSASYGNRMVAIDARHTLFLSTDSGAHWKRVSGPWQGQAVRVNLVLGVGGAGYDGPAAPNASLGALAGSYRAQANAAQGTVAGTVTDTTGAAIAGATVTVTDAATNSSRTAKSDANGHYAVEGLAPGNYNVEAAAPGFAELRLGGVAVEGARPNVANLTLQIGAASEAVTVQAENAAIDQSEDKKAVPRPVDALQPPAVFELTTDTGERWTSTDGKTWKRE
jgi:hypothetical protein